MARRLPYPDDDLDFYDQEDFDALDVFLGVVVVLGIFGVARVCLRVLRRLGGRSVRA